MAKNKGLASWLPKEKPKKRKKPKNLEELFNQYAEDENFFGVDRSRYQGAVYAQGAIYAQGLAHFDKAFKAIAKDIERELYGGAAVQKPSK